MFSRHSIARFCRFVCNSIGQGCVIVQAQQPTISKVDPPDWFVNLPAPMLLLHGTNLADIQITGVPVQRTMASPNDHWVLVWLDTHINQPTTLRLMATTAAGTAAFDDRFQPRHTANIGIAGFSPADLMVCLMPDRFADGDLSNDNLPGSPAADRANPPAYDGGNFKGIYDHLDYLQDLGVTAVWLRLTPVVENDFHARDYHGYGATDLYRIDPRLGTLADYQPLANELHRRGMKLLFDDVPNHVGPAHPWTNDPPLPDWFHGTPAHHLEATYDFGKITDLHLPASAADAELNGWFADILPDRIPNSSFPFSGTMIRHVF